MKEIIIGANEQGKRLDSFLKTYLKDASQSFIYKMLRKKNITLNDKKADGKEKLSKDDHIKIFFSDDTLLKFTGVSCTKTEDYGRALKKFGDIPVIYEDENIILLNKPAGVLSQKAEERDLSLNDWLIDYLLNKNTISKESLLTYRPSICNRLDRNTSGLVICAKSLTGARKMNQLIKERMVDKYYRTVVKGHLQKEMSLQGFLSKDVKSNKVHILDHDPHNDKYSYIETAYRPLEYLKEKDLTLLEVKLITGKPHQIRAHLSSIGHPIIGDVKYGGPKLSGVSSQLLHSYRLIFPKEMEEPFENLSGKEFIAELPDTFNKIITRG